jgi:NAD(P)-dependent dehydrogenase (short-subunit alcohol dehydrogenase family)
MDLGLNNRIALVVGGEGYLGSAIVRRLEAEGARVVIASRRTTSGVRLDARDAASVAAALTTITSTEGRIDALVVAAAPSARTLDPSRNSDPEQVLEAVDGKAMAFLRLANAVLPMMVESGYGRIVGVSGQNALMTGNITGSVRNAALIITAKNLADQAAGTGVTVNVVNPGIVVDHPSAQVERGRAGESSPAQIADLVAFLASPLAAGVSGESIAVGHRVRGVTAF